MKKPLIILFLLVFFLSSCGLAGPQIVTQATVAMAAEGELDRHDSSLPESDGLERGLQAAAAPR